MSAVLPNIPLLRKAVKWAEAEAAKPNGEGAWVQTEWARSYEDCGTSYCIAGYAVLNGDRDAKLGPPSPDYGTHDLLINGRFAHWGDEGQRVLGLTDDERFALFDDENDIEDVRRVAEGIAARAGERL